mgnify:CR=1 FL=1
MRIIMLGAPGAGKGTQAEILSEKFDIPAISTGAIIRQAIKNGSEVGLKAKDYIDKGQLVPDAAIIDIIKDRLAADDCKNGFILDGFPRTIAQAEALEDFGIEIDTALSLEVDDNVIIERLSGRRECSKCGATYHVMFKPSSKGDLCGKCLAPLVTRNDDKPETIKARLDVYHKQTEPLKEFYEKRGKLTKVKGESTVELTTANVLKALEG